MLIILCLSGQEMAQTRQRPLPKGILGARMKIMLEEQLVDPPVVSTRTFLVFFHGFSYNGVCFHYNIPKLYPPSSFGPFLTNYDVTRIERKTAELLGINVLNEV